MLKHVNEREFEGEIKDGVVIVDFYATWCGPCQMLGNVLTEVDKRMPDIKILKVNVDESQKLAMKFKVFAVPTMVFYKDGRMVDKVEGFLNADQLQQHIERIKRG